MTGNKPTYIHLWFPPEKTEKWGPIQHEVFRLLQKRMGPLEAYTFLRWLAEAFGEALGIEHVTRWEGNIDTPFPRLLAASCELLVMKGVKRNPPPRGSINGLVAGESEWKGVRERSWLNGPRCPGCQGTWHSLKALAGHLPDCRLFDLSAMEETEARIENHLAVDLELEARYRRYQKLGLGSGSRTEKKPQPRGEGKGTGGLYESYCHSRAIESHR